MSLCRPRVEYHWFLRCPETSHRTEYFLPSESGASGSSSPDKRRSLTTFTGPGSGCFALLIERYERPLMHFLRDRLGDAGLAEDAAQEAFLAAAMSLENLDRPESFRGWLYRIAYRKGAVMRGD